MFKSRNLEIITTSILTHLRNAAFNTITAVDGEINSLFVTINHIELRYLFVKY